jgi:hypothetical protein
MESDSSLSRDKSILITSWWRNKFVKKSSQVPSDLEGLTCCETVYRGIIRIVFAPFLPSFSCMVYEFPWWYTKLCLKFNGSLANLFPSICITVGLFLCRSLQASDERFLSQQKYFFVCNRYRSSARPSCSHDTNMVICGDCRRFFTDPTKGPGNFRLVFLQQNSSVAGYLWPKVTSALCNIHILHSKILCQPN